MSLPFNFSNLQTSTSASSGSQLLLRLDTALSGAPAFARITQLNFEKSLGVYSAVQANSAYWQDTYTGFSTQSANNASVYSTVQTNSATNWNYQGSDIRALTANWQNTFTAFGAQSADNISVFSNVNSNSANWQNVFTVYSLQSAGLASLYSTVQTNSATNWRGLTIFTQVSSSSLISPNSAIPVHGLSAVSLSSSVDFAIIPTLSGALLAQIPDGTIANGNKRGTYATDWQRLRDTLPTRVASGYASVIGGGINNTAGGGSQSVVGGGLNNTASGLQTVIGGGRDNLANQAAATVGGGYLNRATAVYATVAGGRENTASEEYSVGSGYYSNSRLYGQFAHASGRFSVTGDAQYVRWIVRNTTFSNLVSSLYLDGISKRITLQQNYIYSLNFKIMGVNYNGTEYVEYNKRTLVRCLSTGDPNIDIISNVDIIPPVDDSPAEVTVAIVNSDDSINVNVTGVNGATWKWLAVVEGTEMRFAQS